LLSYQCTFFRRSFSERYTCLDGRTLYQRVYQSSVLSPSKYLYSFLHIEIHNCQKKKEKRCGQYFHCPKHNIKITLTLLYIVKFYHCFVNFNATLPPDSPAYSNISLDFVFEFCEQGMRGWGCTTPPKIHNFFCKIQQTFSEITCVQSSERIDEKAGQGRVKGLPNHIALIYYIYRFSQGFHTKATWIFC
jgi:hypothetical protein